MAAVITQGTAITIGGATLTGVTDITPPSATRSTVDVTNLLSPDKTKEYAGGLIDGGEMSATAIVGVGNGALSTISAFIEDYGAPKACSITLADSSSVSFDGIVTKFQVDGIATGDNTVKATVGVKPVGKITYSFD
jgi:hypothetical protein